MWWFSWAPGYDGEFFPYPPSWALKEGYIHKKDVLIGANKDEGSMFTGKKIMKAVS